MTRERLVVPAQCRQQEQHSRSEIEMDTDLSVSGCVIKLLPVTQKCLKILKRVIQKLGSLQYGMAGKIEISRAKRIPLCFISAFSPSTVLACNDF